MKITLAIIGLILLAVFVEQISNPALEIGVICCAVIGAALIAEIWL